MSTRYDGVILDHLAEHMLYLSTDSLFWFSLSSRHDHGFHLSQLLGMSPHDYECLLVVRPTSLQVYEYTSEHLKDYLGTKADPK